MPTVNTWTPQRPGETNVAYILREAARHRVRPWELPGLAYIAPPPIGNARASANRNPADWLRALDEAGRHSHVEPPVDRLRDMVGRSSPLLPFNSAERRIHQWAHRSQPGAPAAPRNTAVWVLAYQRTMGERAARAAGADEAQVRAAGQAAVNAGGDQAVAQGQVANQQAHAAGMAYARARINRLESQQRLIETLAPQRVAQRAVETVGRTPLLSIGLPLTFAGLLVVGGIVFFRR